MDLDEDVEQQVEQRSLRQVGSHQPVGEGVRFDIPAQPCPEVGAEQVPHDVVDGSAPTFGRAFARGSQSLTQLEATDRLEEVRLRRQADLWRAVEDVAERVEPVLGLPTTKS